VFKKQKSQPDVDETIDVPAQLLVSSPTRVAVVAASEGGSVQATYEIEDFAALDEAEVAALLARAETDHNNAVPSCSHLVVSRDLSTGLVNHYVPFNNGLEALQLAAQVVIEKRAEEPGRTFTITVTPLLPHSV
jgi:hypothetical protein